MNNDPTICAIATAQGGAIGIIRVSGNEAIEITEKIFSPAGKPTGSCTTEHHTPSPSAG